MLVGCGPEFKLDNKWQHQLVGHKKTLCSENLEHLSNSLIGSIHEMFFKKKKSRNHHTN